MKKECLVLCRKVTVVHHHHKKMNKMKKVLLAYSLLNHRILKLLNLAHLALTDIIQEAKLVLLKNNNRKSTN